MDRKIKLVTVGTLIAIFISVSFLAYANNIQSNTDDNETNRRGPPDNRPPDNRPPTKTVIVMPPNVTVSSMLSNETLRLIERFLRNATIVAVNGTVIRLIDNFFVLRTATGDIRTFVADAWSVNTTVMSTRRLFNNTFTGPGQNITAWTLKSVVFTGTNFDINIMFAYAITNAQGITATAILPFNIEPKP